MLRDSKLMASHFSFNIFLEFIKICVIKIMRNVSHVQKIRERVYILRMTAFNW